MAFSLFGKKDDPPSKKPEPKKADPAPAASGKAAPPAPAAVSASVSASEPPPPRAVDEDDDLSLDFTSFVPLPMGGTEGMPASQALDVPVIAVPPLPAANTVSPKPEANTARAVQQPAQAAVPAAAAAPKPPPVAPTKIPASPAVAPKAETPIPLKPAPVAASKAVPAATGAPAPKPAPVAQAKPQRKPLPPDSVMSIEVTSATDGLAVVEEAAILFANAQDQSALAVLLNAVREDDNSKPARQIWLMLFDLYQHLGMKKEHEELALEFAAKFERSPPTWIERQAKAVAAMLNTGGSSFVAFGEVLDARITVQIDQARQISGKSPALRFDLSKLVSVDATGCRLLLQCLQQLKRDAKSVVLSGEAKIIALLVAQAGVGDKAADQAFWLLLLEVYQMLGLHDAYEEAALNFAITYELSPPAWEQAALAPAPRGAVQFSGAAQAVTAEQVMRLTGDITGADSGTLKAIVDYAADLNPVVIDFSAVPRVDFVNAGQLLNTFSKLHKAGKTVKIRGANELIVALFGVMGVQAVTGIEQKR